LRQEYGKAEQNAKKFRAEAVFTDIEPMLHLDLDLVDIVTPIPTHGSLAIRALN